MVQYCVAYGCKNIHDARKKISFHSFPFKHPNLLDAWVNAIRRQDWHPSKSSRICSKHFLPTDYLNKPGSTIRLLKPDAIPSVFEFPKHLQSEPNPRRKLQRQLPVEPMEVDTGSMPSTSTASLHKYVDRETQTTLELSSMILLLQRQVKTLKQKVRRRDIKLSNMKDVIKEITKGSYGNENLEHVLKNYFEGLPLELVLLQKKNTEKKQPGQRRYTLLMKQFAHTVYFYSQKAYNFLRQYFILPNGRTIRKWLHTVNCEPGILNEVMEYLKSEVKSKKFLCNCALIVDGFSIRKQIVWDDSQGKFFGNVNYGGIVDVDYEMAASEALFFQIVSYTTNWKCPVAYFLINKVDANIQTQLIKSCLRSLYECGVIIRSITSDGAQANILTYRNLGCHATNDAMVPYFMHPCSSTIKIHCILDSCHMLKLARNVFAEKTLKSSLGNISWQYLKELDAVQQQEQLRLANSLTTHHVNFKNKIMNVKLAAQSISSGVADAIEFLDKSGMQKFKNSSATVEFIRIIDRLFDMVNCRNPYGKGFKAPIRPSTIKYTEEVFCQTTEYLKSLSIDGVMLLNHTRKTFALGFILTMQSTINLAKDLFSLDEPLQYFLPYKYSQDHLELFFSCIRSRGGWNNNPNSQQLRWALRQLLFKNSITASFNGNCCDFEEFCTPAFEFRSTKRQRRDIPNDGNTNELKDLVHSIQDNNLTYFQENVIFYISGYIVRTLVQNSTCRYCVKILLYREEETDLDHTYSAPAKIYQQFTNYATRGGLLYASKIIYEIVKFIEKQFRILVNEGNVLKNNSANIKRLLINSAIRHFSEKIHTFLPRHPVTQYLYEELHEIQIIRKVTEIFLKCRMHHHSKLLNLKLHGKSASIRQKMTKLVLFKNC